jgi:hypothetical protein
MSLRTQQDRGEVIYSAELPPLPRGDDFAAVYLPFSSMRLVRGPRLVPDAPPVDPKAVFQVSASSTTLLVVSLTFVFLDRLLCTHTIA